MSYQMVLQPLSKHTATVIFAHGLGDTAAGWLDFADSMKPRFPHIKWILPTAPIAPVSINGGMPITSWFDITALNARGLPTSEDEKGMLKSARRISDYVTAEVDAGIPADRIIVGGFSQGAVVTLLAAITMERKLAGVITLSGWLALSQKTAMMQTEHAKKLPIIWGHGRKDDVVKFAWGQASVDKLRELGFANVEFNTYPDMQHWLCEEESEHVAQFLAKILPPV